MGTRDVFRILASGIAVLCIAGVGSIVRLWLQSYDMKPEGTNCSYCLGRQVGVQRTYPHSLLVVVKTGPHYFARRIVTRRLWFQRCNSRQFGFNPSARSAGADSQEAAELQGVENMLSRIRVQCIFLTGHPEDTSVMAKLQAEVKQHQDVFVAPIPDRYSQMTSKSLWSIQWAVTQEELYDYIMLVDDDTYIVLEKLVLWILLQPRVRFYAGHEQPLANRGLIYCRDQPKYQNCVANSLLFPGGVYPPFASGFAYVMSRDVASTIIFEALAKSGLALPGNIEDAMMGTLLNRTGISLTNEIGFYHWLEEKAKCNSTISIMVVGNAPISSLTKMATNDRLGRPLCHGLEHEPMF